MKFFLPDNDVERFFLNFSLIFHFPSIFLEKTENTICRVVKVPTYLHALTCTVHVLYMSVHVVKQT